MNLFRVKRSVTLTRWSDTDKDDDGNLLKGRPLVILTDEADDKVHIDIINKDGKSVHWCRVPKRDLFVALVSLWPDEVAIADEHLKDDNE